MTDQNYFDELIIQFPSLQSVIHENGPEMIHMHMERFADYTIEQIKRNNTTELKKCFDFQESKIDSMSSQLQNALVVSYCESLLFSESANKMQQVMHLMSPKLKEIYTDYENWHNGHAKKGNKKDR
jgi:hypothetical protein